MNLVHAYVIEQTESTEQERADRLRQIERRLTGAMSTRRALPATDSAVESRRGPAVPSWWVDDEDASASSTAAMKHMRRG